MEKVKGMAMVAFLFGLTLLWLPSLSFPAPSSPFIPRPASHTWTMTGVLKGYFLSPDGTLKVREIPFAFPERPAAPDLPERLFSLTCWLLPTRQVFCLRANPKCLASFGQWQVALAKALP
jgi:hypothetical protein